MPDNPRIEELRRRVEADPNSIAFAALAEEYRRAGRLREAVELCRKGLERHPAYASARVTLGRALLELGQLEEAKAELERVLRITPENLAAIRALADIHARSRGSLHQRAAGEPLPDVPVPSPSPPPPPPPEAAASPTIKLKERSGGVGAAPPPSVRTEALRPAAQAEVSLPVSAPATAAAAPPKGPASTLVAERPAGTVAAGPAGEGSAAAQDAAILAELEAWLVRIEALKAERAMAQR
ncbi:MAG TPA: tetratricopeptide repeat protein [Vicinamibacterales bacterium]|nr:tetratricopeptide repeat protein [Vicinamibacterales bacterium]